MTSDKPHDVVRLATAANAIEAHIWQQALDQEGISCKVVGDFLEAGYGNIPGIFAEIWVHQNDLARAQDVLRQRAQSTEDVEEDAEE